MPLPGVLGADPQPVGVNAVIVDAATPSPAAMEALARHYAAVRTVLFTTSSTAAVPSR